ncbi:Long-chain fatty acid transport protein 1-like protein, partial [Leptotrombidium deliense]
VAVYIGELTSYLLNQPERFTDRSHKVRKMYGVGLRGAIWKKFVDRFQISKVVEMYGSSEGNASIFNFDNKEGACGFVPVCSPKFIRKMFFRATFIKVDVDTGEPIRHTDGLCISCEPGEIGMIVGKIDKSNPLTRFDGYVDKNETEKKIIRDVLEKGDAYYSSGDLLRMDHFGYIYFHDRLGDTFRWKGENVSTSQVEDVVRNILRIVDCVVYGVKIPNTDGRAGMLAVVTNDSSALSNLEHFYKQLSKQLPKYAIPAFIRIVSNVEMTGTFKFSKVQLKNEAFDVNLISDPIYVFDAKKQTYVTLDRKLFDELMNGKFTF